jgi:hypothetical protein
VADLDRRCVVQGRQEDEVRALFASAEVAQAVLQFLVDGNGRAVVSEHGVSVFRQEVLSKPGELEALLERVVAVVERIESALHLSPEDAPRTLDGPPDRARLPWDWQPPGGLPAPEPAAAPGPPPAPSGTGSTADSYIAQLAGSGAGAQPGSFTIDRSAARLKLEQYQLREPAEAALAFVRAAVAKGATVIDLALEAGRYRLTFDGRPFGTNDLEELYGALMSPGTDAEVEARRLLACGIATAAGIPAREIRLRSGDGLTGVELRFRPDAPDQYGPSDRPVTGTEIEVSLPLADWITGLLGRTGDLVRSRCRYAPVTIRVEGTQVSGARAPTGAWGLAALEGGGVTGCLGFTRQPGGTALVRWIREGVVVVTEPVDGLPRDLVAVASAPRVRLDLSQANVVRDAAWVRALGAIRDCLPQAYQALAEAVESRREDRFFPLTWGCEHLRRLLLGFGDLAHLQPGGHAHWLATPPLFATADGGFVSLSSLWALAAAGQPVHCSEVPLHLGDLAPTARLGEIPDPRLTLLLSWTTDRRERCFLQRALGGRFVDVTARLRALPRDPARVRERVSRLRW